MSAFDPAQLLRESNLTEEQFAQTKLEWDCLQEICSHHIAASPARLSAARFISDRLQSVSAVHSLKVRIKDPLHLISKIIRKKRQNQDLDVKITTYEDIVTDLIGIRALHLFKGDWREIHDFIISTWERYEKPFAYIRDGDPKTLRDDLLSAGCDVKIHENGYRSIHYVVEFQPGKKTEYAEIQVRTIFEEGWSEIDHTVRYPTNTAHSLLNEFLTIFNGLAGGADEMGSFIRLLNAHLLDHDLTVGHIKAELDAKTSELRQAISALHISQKDKASLQARINDMQVSSHGSIMVNVSQPMSVLINNPLTSNITLSPTIINSSYPAISTPSFRECSKCHSYCQTTEPSVSGQWLCPNCASKGSSS